MPKIRRVIQSVSKPEPVGFDAQYWPILIAISILFGLLMGAVLTLLSGIWLWFSLLAIPVMVFSSSIALRFVDNRHFKRSSQLALITSLIVHLVMLLSAHHWQLFGTDEQANEQIVEQKQPEKKNRATIPIVFETQQWNQSQQKMTPQPNEEQVEQSRAERERQIEKEEQVTPVDQTQRQVTQNQNHQRQTRQTVPKQSQTLSKLSRSDLRAEPKSGTRVSETPSNSPQNNPNPSENRPAELSATKSPEPRRTPAEIAKASPSSARPDASRQSQATTARMDRRTTELQQPQPTETANQPAARSNRNQPTPTPATVAKSSLAVNKTARPSAPPQSQPVLKPTQVEIAQTSRNRMMDQPTQKAPRQSIASKASVKQPLAARRPEQKQTPKIAQAPVSRTRVSNPTPVPNPTTIESPQRIVQAPRNSPQLNPRATNASMSRSTRVTPQSARVQIDAPEPQTSAITQSATRASRRPNNTLPSVTPNANPDTSPRRSSQTAPEVASSTSVETPARSASQSKLARDEGQPRNTTLNKSTVGTAGIGESANVQSDSPAAAKPSLVASDSAVRRTSTQSTPRDIAFQPIQSAETRRSMADRSTPSAELKVENSPNAKIAGSNNPAELNAQSSASQISASSTAKSGQVNAAQGSSTLDTGATKMVSETGQGRASGGGQPDVDREIRSSSAENSRRGQVTNNSLAANLKADVPTAPADLGGGRPSETTPDPNSTSLAKTVAGQGNRAAAGPSSTMLAGPLEEASSAPSKSNATIAKTAPNETADGDLVQGGGTPDQNSALRRIRSSPSGANANTKVTFSGNAYTDREEGLNATDDASAAREVGASDTQLAGRKTSNTTGVGQSQASPLLAGGAEKSEGSIAQGNLSRQQSEDNSGMKPDTATGSRQVASGQGDNNPRRLGATGPKLNARVDLGESGGAGSGDSTRGIGKKELAGLSGNGDIGIKRRDRSGGQSVRLDMEQGPGGLGSKMAVDTGINSRRARLDSSSIELKVDTRFQRQDAGGDPQINTKAVFSKGAFKGRDMGKKGAAAPSTEPSIEMGLAWLAQQQRSTGNWSLTSSGISEDEAEKIVYDTPTAATGLALLAFQGAGYNHKEYRYAEVVNQGVQWLVSNQSDDGCLYVKTNDSTNDVCRLYSHGIATIALCEAYGMTNDPDIKTAAQKSLDYISASQDKINGGWRYIPGQGSDTSVTGWMVMALKSGKLAGLKVNPETLNRVDRWLGFAASGQTPHRFRYNPNATSNKQYPNREVQGKTPTACMTSVGLLLRLYSGWSRTDQKMIDGARSLLSRMPSEDSVESRNTYYWYYATQVLKHVGGEFWDTWYKDSLYPLLIRSQKKSGPMQGSWDPLYPVPDRWGYFSGRLYVTTMNLLTLEVKWRLLPLYEETVK